jgi:hypothetical protein
MNTEDKSVILACTLAPGELSQRREEIIAALFKRAVGTRELDQGLEFVFPGEETLISSLMDFIKFERNCCRFLRFELIFEPEQGSLHLRILGTPEAKPVIREMFVPRSR